MKPALKCLFVLLLCAAVLCSIVISHAPTKAAPPLGITVHYQTFDVYSTDWDKLMKEVHDFRQKAINGNMDAVARRDGTLNMRLADNLLKSNKKYPDEKMHLDNGVFAVSLSYFVGPKQPRTGLNCFILDVNITGGVTVYLPKWINYVFASPQDQRRWTHFYDKLLDQETGGIDIVLKDIKATESDLEAIKDVDCKFIEGKTILEFYDHVSALIQRSKFRPDVTADPEFAPKKEKAPEPAAKLPAETLRPQKDAPDDDSDDPEDDPPAPEPRPKNDNRS